MAILINQDTRALIQGITGVVGAFQTKVMLDYGTNVVAGVTPGKGGMAIHQVPIFDFVQDAVEACHPNAAFCFVPARYARDAAIEVIAAGIPFLVLTAEGIPERDMLAILQYAATKGTRILGPDTPGIISPGKCKLGVHPNRMYKEGSIGVLSKSGALSYEVCKTLTEHGIGQSTVVGIGGGPLWGMTQRSALELFEADPETKAVVLLGEVGGNMEVETAAFIKERMSKPVVALIVGRTAPPGAQMGHAGAIIEGKEATAHYKIELLKQAGARIANQPLDIPRIIHEVGV
jgi:succinyl-CoA synthetase alpha subunit